MSDETVVESAAKEAAEEKMTPEKMKEELKAEVMKQLAKEGCTKEMLDAWKAQWGPLGFLPIGEQLYVIRPLMRKEWKEMNKIWQARSQGESPVTQFDTEEEIAARALLWPQLTILDMKTKLPAGVPSTLAEGISQHAGFVPNATPIVF